MEQTCFEGVSPHCDLDLDRNPNVLHDTQGHDGTPMYQVSLRKVKWFRRYIVRTTYIFLEDLNPHCDLDLEQSNPKVLHNTLARDDAPLYQVC